ncbi:acylneuraminate cytidylyltransferase family protein [Hydrogenovibrio kuenenii]|uniref:acylneuraminate cytidylyltransferase family protein n=1 Tax=Hydrogenovibrio kuenenii TaxID=63658 RepID=UPI0004B404DC|nr:acylneuraminate cytidylyltransferase family protein [Hydrogenovibrio kuenenii]
MKVLALIPARQGSKRLPNKNIKMLAGKPLIAWTIEAALASDLVKDRMMDVFVSTDSEEIADIAREHGAKVPFLRPDELASDTASTKDAITHALKTLKEMGQEYDCLILLQPTSPLRQSFHIDEAFALFLDKDAESVTSVSELEHPIEWTMTLEDDLKLDNFFQENAEALKTRSQDLPTRYRLNGALVIHKTKTFFADQVLPQQKDVYAYVMERKYAVDIDELADFQYAEYFVTHQHLL